ncbi:hypothetical protein COCNU_scaffold022946G000010 [Cocos nucifera]|nr:hypothetical protein [Cocos nucifera]
MKVGHSSFAVPTSTIIALEVIASTEVALAAEVGTASTGSMPPIPLGPSNGDRASEPPIEEEVGEGRKKKRSITKTSHKAHLSRADGDSDERGEDPFDNLKIIRDLTDRFAMPESGHQMLAYIKRACGQEAEAQRIQEGLRAKICRLQKRVTEVEHSTEEKMANIESL